MSEGVGQETDFFQNLELFTGSEKRTTHRKKAYVFICLYFIAHTCVWKFLHLQRCFPKLSFDYFLVISSEQSIYETLETRLRKTQPGMYNPSFYTERSMYNSAVFIIQDGGGACV